MTPEEAEHWHDHLVKMGHTEGNPERRAFHTIAGLEWEYGFQWLDIFGGWVQFTQWHKNLAVVEHAANLKAQNTTKGKTRIVRRLVSKPQPIGDNQ